MKEPIRLGDYVIGTSNLGICVVALVTRKDPVRGLGQFGIFNGREVQVNDPIRLTEEDVVNMGDDPRKLGGIVGYLEAGEWKTATGAEAERVWRARSGES